MLIDFRVRPPYKSFLDMVFYVNRQYTIDFTRSVGLSPAPSLVEGSIDLFVKEMDEAGVTTAVVAGRKAVAPWASVLNSDVAELVSRYPARFRGFAGVDLSSRESALRDLEEGLVELGLSGVSLDPGFALNPIYADNREIMYPVYERCLELGVPVMITASHLAGPDITWGDPLPIDRAARDFPTLPIIAAHGCWPNVMQMLAVAHRRSNVYVMGDIYMYNMPGLEQFVRAANFYLQDRFLYATSFPLAPLPEGVREYRALPFTETALRKSTYDNAARLLKL